MPSLLVSLGLGVLTLLLTLLPVPSQFPVAIHDKSAHATLFALLVLPGAWMPSKMRLVVFACAFGLGGLIEYLQPLVGRDRALGDLVANLVGMGLGALLGWGLKRLAHRGHAP